VAFSQRIRQGLRSLRFRLVISYVVVFGLLLGGVGLVFHYDLTHTIDRLQRELIDEDWDAAAGFLDIRNGQATWTVDPRKPDHSFIVDRLRRNLLIAGPDGSILEAANGYRIFGVETPSELRAIFESGQTVWRTKTEPSGAVLLLRYGTFRSGNESCLLAIGRRVTDFSPLPATITGDFFLALPFLLLAAALTGWAIAGSALRPVNELAETAQRISGSNLDLRLQGRGANDELEKLIEAFNTMMDRLETNFDQIRHFSTDASHELRTPITIIRGQLEVAMMTARTPGDFRDAIATALQEVDRLSSIVRGLLLLSQAETGQIRIRNDEVSLSEIVAELGEQFTVVAADASVRLVVDAPSVGLVRGDRTHLERLVTNLLSNAIKYTNPGGSVHVQLAETDTHVTLSVSDTGIGIAAEHLPRIFERFYRVSAGETRKGLGLGLSFVSWIAKAHGGEVTVTSELGKGTAFLVQIPKLQEAGRSTAHRSLAEARQ